MSEVHGNNPVDGGTADKLQPSSKSPDGDVPQENGQETLGKDSPVVNGASSPRLEDVGPTEAGSESVGQDRPKEDGDDSLPQRHSTPKPLEIDTARKRTPSPNQISMPKRTPTPKSDDKKSDRAETPQIESGQKADSPKPNLEQTEQNSKTPEPKSSKSSHPVAEVEQNEVNEQKESEVLQPEKPVSPKIDAQSQRGEGERVSDTLDGNQGDVNMLDQENEQGTSPGGDTTNQTDRPTSVQRSREKSPDGAGDDKRIGSGTSRHITDAPAASDSVPMAADGNHKVVLNEPDGVEKELCDFVRDYVCQLKQMKTYDNPETLKLVKGISQSYWRGKAYRVAIAQVLCEEGFAALATHALKTLNDMGMFRNDSIWFPSYYFLNTVWNFSDSNPEFATDVADVGMLDLLVANISHKPYLENLSSKNVTYIVKSSLSIMHNVARSPGTSPAFRDLRTEEALMPFFKGTTKNDFMQALAVLTLANIADDLSTFTDIGSESTGAIDFIVDCMKKALRSDKRRFRGFMASELADGLAKLAAQDSAKSKIIQAGALPVFKEMLKSHDRMEQHAAAQAIWSLAFDEVSRRAILDEPEIMQNLEASMKSSDEDVKLSCLGALWILKKKLVERSESRRAIIKRQTTLEEQKDVKDRLIFISYSWHDKKKVRKIAARLKELGYNIWIDHEQMKENILQAMAQGIEDSAIFLMCMSESYKESPNCRTEAEYAFKLQKPVIPLMMQKRYTPDGWLGIILGTKLYFNFTGKVPFDEIFEKFLKEMNMLGGGDEVIKIVVHNDSTQSSTPTAHKSSKKDDALLLVRNWTSADILRWLEDNDLSSCKSKFKDFDGHHWCGLIEMKKEAPQYYYQTIEHKIGLSFLDILKFSEAISYFLRTGSL
ncbi:uncharacterized protein LOC135498927 [Lineus longissimus]|uniref:uncharacterized protein LOC135498927 n=1 Tax=Lineus longissimus TaxID=88925 RepID=UPI002B4CCE6F